MKSLLGHKACLSWASSLLLAVLAAHAQAAAPDALGVSLAPTKRSPVRQYSVVNLVSQDGMGVLNQQGQAAFTGYIGGETAIGFFDGKRLHTVHLPANGMGLTHVHDLNDSGVAVIEANDPDAGFPLNARAFSWSLAKGGCLLTSSRAGSARAINKHNQIAGYVQVSGQSGRANRWNPDGSQTALGGLPTAYSEAMAINDNGLSAGYFDNRATVWDAKGTAIDLGAMGGTGAIASFLNAKDQAAGTFNAGGSSGVFVWSRKDGLALIGPFDRSVKITGFNDHGQVAADRQIAQEGLTVTFAPFIWSAKRGLKMVPLAGAAHGRVDALNNRAEMVGYTQRVAFDNRSKRAMYWNDVSDPVDLNTRLYRAPAGLLLSAAMAINDDGTILAASNAGLVLLRPGRTGTAAPVLGPLTAPPAADYATVGNTLDFAVNFVDGNPTETHVATASVNDGCPQTPPSLREVRGAGDVSLRHTFCQSGFFSLRITVTDQAGNATQSERQIYIGQASGATLMGQVTLPPPAGNATRFTNVPLQVALLAPLQAHPGAGATGQAAKPGTPPLFNDDNGIPGSGRHSRMTSP